MIGQASHKVARTLRGTSSDELSSSGFRNQRFEMNLHTRMEKDFKNGFLNGATITRTAKVKTGAIGSIFNVKRGKIETKFLFPKRLCVDASVSEFISKRKHHQSIQIRFKLREEIRYKIIDMSNPASDNYNLKEANSLLSNESNYDPDVIQLTEPTDWEGPSSSKSFLDVITYIKSVRGVQHIVVDSLSVA